MVGSYTGACGVWRRQPSSGPDLLGETALFLEEAACWWPCTNVPQDTRHWQLANALSVL